MKIAIVGSSHLSEGEERTARQLSATILKSYVKNHGIENVILISGGAKGVDTQAEDVAKGLGIKCKIFKPTEWNWDGYKVRNMAMAQECDILYCLPTKLKIEPCYHCNATDHERSGACWTMKHAKSLKKEVHLFPLI